MRIFVLFLIFHLVLLSEGKSETAYPDSSDTCFIRYQEMIDDVIQQAGKYIGTPYRYGGKNPKGFDCSGFVHYIFEPHGLNLPYSSRGYVNIGEEIDASEARRGDFVLFKGRNASSNIIGHVALVVDVDEKGSVYILHATVQKGVTIDNMSDVVYYQKRYLSMRRYMPPCEQEHPQNSTESGSL
jgi:cell wall-associated NlpC family hydrolase